VHHLQFCIQALSPLSTKAGIFLIYKNGYFSYLQKSLYTKIAIYKNHKIAIYKNGPLSTKNYLQKFLLIYKKIKSLSTKIFAYLQKTGLIYKKVGLSTKSHGFLSTKQ